MVVRPDLGANFNTNISTYVVFIGVPLDLPFDASRPSRKCCSRASRRKRQGSVNGYEIPKDVCREVESRLNVNTTEANNNIFVSCPSAGSHRVTYHCHFYPNRYPRYLIQAKPCRTGGCLSCNNDDSFCGEHNITVTVAEPSGNCRWTAISIQVRVGCRCNIPPRRS